MKRTDRSTLQPTFQMLQPTTVPSTKARAWQKKKVLFIANAYLPTLQLSFVKPLAKLVEVGALETDFLLETEISATNHRTPARLPILRRIDRWLAKRFTNYAMPKVSKRFSNFKPDVVVFCRYSGPYATEMVHMARKAGASVIFHIDDDLLNVPREIGEKKYQYHNRPQRLATVRHLLDHADLVYCSTDGLKHRLVAHQARSPLHVGTIYCSGEILVEAKRRPVRKIGYMGFDHAHDFEIVLPALVELLRRHQYLQFELFGSIPKPSVLDEFGSRVTVLQPVRDYAEFMDKFASLGWDIGLCPLAVTDFNAVKANTKWVEYTSIGAAVVATGGTIYDSCCSSGAGLLIRDKAKWLAELDALVLDEERRYQMVVTAQRRLEEHFSTARLRDQVLEVFDLASRTAENRASGTGRSAPVHPPR